MALIILKNIDWGLGGTPLIEKLTLKIEKGERIGLVGRNGVGKSTLLKLLDDSLLPDSGDRWCQQGLIVSALAQDLLPQQDQCLFDVVAGGFDDTKVAAVTDRERSNRIESLLSRAGLNPDLNYNALSVGLKRRTLFCRAMVSQPDLLLLDEPTNHLDIDTISWMEDFLRRYATTLLFVTHDRTFLKNLATRIIELDRGRLTSYACDYPTYLKRKQAMEHSEATQEKTFDKKLSREEAWIRQGIKARRTRNMGRVRSLEKLREAYRLRRRKMDNARIQLQDAERTGKLVVQAKAVSYSYEDTLCIDNFSTDIMRSDKLGLIGPNGVGKSTLLKILLKELEPDKGSVRYGTKIEVAYFDQLRDQLEEQKSVVDNIGEGNDFITFNGQKRHVISYLQDFLFTPERSRTPVHILSGGEKNRLLLAKLFTKPANVLVLDEPTNDLDLETLELLEALLVDYTGTLLLVSHDRTFLNNVVTASLAFEGNGRIITYPGGYDDWMSQRPAPPTPPRENIAKKKNPRPRTQSGKARKLGYMEKRELEALPDTIEALENEQQQLFSAASDPGFYKKNKEEISAIQLRLEQVQAEIEAAYQRWESLGAI